MLDRIAGRLDYALGRLTMRAIGTAAHAASLASSAHAALTQGEQDLAIERDVPYGLLAAHKLDVYRDRNVRGSLPVLLYVLIYRPRPFANRLHHSRHVKLLW